MPTKVFLHPIPYGIALCALLSGILANQFNLGPAYTYPFALAVLVLTAVNAKKGTSSPEWTIGIPSAWMASVTPVVSGAAALMTALVPALTGPLSPYHLSWAIVAILTALVLVLNWLAQSLQEVEDSGQPASMTATATTSSTSAATVTILPTPAAAPATPVGTQPHG